MTPIDAARPERPISLGLGENAAPFSLLVVVNAFVGAMAGMERSILPAIAEREFHLARAAVLSFIVVFGITKAVTNYLAGRLSERVGRKRVLVGGWLVATPDSGETSGTRSAPCSPARARTCLEWTARCGSWRP